MDFKGGDGGGARMSIPELHIARTVPQVHDHVQFGVESGSRQEVSGKTGKLYEIKRQTLATVQWAAVQLSGMC